MNLQHATIEQTIAKAMRSMAVEYVTSAYINNRK